MATVRQSLAIVTDPASSATESLTITGCLAGSMLLAIYSAYQSNQPNPIVSSVDAAGVSFSMAARADRGLDDFECGVFFLANITAGNHTVDFNMNAVSSTLTNLTVLEISNVPTTSPVSFATSANNLSSAGTLSFTTGTLAEADMLLIGVCATAGDFASDINLAATSSVGADTVTNIREQPDGNTVGTLITSIAPTTTASRTITFTHNTATYGNVGILIGIKTASSAQRFKFFVKPSAASVGSVSAVCWADSGITGTEYIEASSLTFQASLDSGRAVLYVHCPADLSLANGTAVKGVAYNSTYTTGLMTGVVEAGAA